MKIGSLAWINARHDFWCEELELFMLGIGVHQPTRPKCSISNAATNTAGRYFGGKRHQCVYMKYYAAFLKEAYDSTIAHEVCHAYQKQIMQGCKWHGDFFLFLVRVVCGFDNENTGHRFPVATIKKIAELAELQESIAACEVVR